VALRLPAHPVARAVLAAAGRPLAAPSANVSGHVSPTTAVHVAADLGDNVALILDAGPTSVGIESTIVGLAGEQPILLRSGGVPREALEQLLALKLAVPEHGSATIAPGMLASHYAPAAQLRLGAIDVREGEALLAFGPVAPSLAAKASAVRNLSPTGNLAEAATNLFAFLRDLDAKAQAIAVTPIPEEGLGEAINDRLRRAAAPRS
jgi:L-threonylcarbamoyladenylate synthase